MLELETQKETFDLHTSFSISRGSNDTIDVVTVKITDGTHSGFGECRPYDRYNETPDSVISTIHSVTKDIENGASRSDLIALLPAGAARNAIDCALWDLEAKQTGTSVWHLIGGVDSIKPVQTVQTLSLLNPDEMASKAKEQSDFNILKIKLGGDRLDQERLEKIEKARPDAKLVIDANESWTSGQLEDFIREQQNSNIMMIEQPLPKNDDNALQNFDSGKILICGDESIHDMNDLIAKKDLYDMVNIKLDKAGGLTHALQMIQQIHNYNEQGHNIKLMIGCMVCSSLAIAPHILLAQNCDLADLDGPGWLANDRLNGISFKDGMIIPSDIWG